VRHPSQRGDHSRESLISRLDRAADTINPFLIVVMVGLLLLNATRLVTLAFPGFPITRADPNCAISPASSAGNADAVIRPSRAGFKS
jgi:hypothetical protein